MLGHDTALFRRLVLGWIEADFRVQIRILQHFSKSTRKSSSREQILQMSAKELENFAKSLTFFGKFCRTSLSGAYAYERVRVLVNSKVHFRHLTKMKAYVSRLSLFEHKLINLKVHFRHVVKMNL